MYAGLDAIKSLKIYFKIYKLQDLSLQLNKSDFVDNLNVEILLAHRNADDLTLAAAIGSLTSIKETKAPPLC